MNNDIIPAIFFIKLSIYDAGWIEMICLVFLLIIYTEKFTLKIFSIDRSAIILGKYQTIVRLA
jgi:hypothetical protein